MAESHKNYTVIDTEGMSAETLQKVLNNATEGFPEMQIEHVIGTTIIMGHESLLNEKGRTAARQSMSAGVLRGTAF